MTAAGLLVLGRVVAQWGMSGSGRWDTGLMMASCMAFASASAEVGMHDKDDDGTRERDTAIALRHPARHRLRTPV